MEYILKMKETNYIVCLNTVKKKKEGKTVQEPKMIVKTSINVLKGLVVCRTAHKNNKF